MKPLRSARTQLWRTEMKTDSVHVDAGQWKLINRSLAQATVRERNAGVERTNVDASSFLQLQSSAILNFPLWRLEADVKGWMASDRKGTPKGSDCRRRPGVRQRINWDVKQWPSCHNRNICSCSLASFCMGAQTDNAPSLIYQTPNLNSSHPLYMTGSPAVWIEHPLSRLDNSLKKETPVHSLAFPAIGSTPSEIWWFFSCFFSNQSAFFLNMLRDSAATQQPHDERFKVWHLFLLRLFMKFICRQARTQYTAWLRGFGSMRSIQWSNHVCVCVCVWRREGRLSLTVRRLLI